MPAIQFLAVNFPNRHSDKTVVETRLKFDPAETYDQSQLQELVRQVLLNNNLLNSDEPFPEQGLPKDRVAFYASLLMQTALLFQRKAGHPVDFYSVSSTPGGNSAIALVEHQHCDVGLTAVKLAVEVLGGKRRLLSEPFQAFSTFAHERLLPLDTVAIVEAARRCDIPTTLLERLPFKREDFDEITAGDCIRRNGLIMLGHGRFRCVLDGTFCLDRSPVLNAVRLDGRKRRHLLKRLELPVAVDGSRTKPTGDFYLVVVNGQVSAVINTANGRALSPAVLDEALVEKLVMLNCDLEFAPMGIRILTYADGRSITLTASRIVDFELAPNLDAFARQGGDKCPDWLESTAGLILDWLFEGDNPSRIPIVAVTGTNGKTTTTRMINHIFRVSGRRPGMVCTDGVFLDNRELLKGDQGTVGGHLKILTHPQAEIAVLETHHNGILKNGFAFEWCDVAICLNVTEDHIGEANIETIGQMAEVKRALIERARHAVILNADDQHCLAMRDFTRAERKCLVSMKKSAAELLPLVENTKGCLCVLENMDGETHLVMYDNGFRLPVVSVNRIPMTFNGAARFNTSNAMHAVLAAYLAGTGLEDIRNAMVDFHASWETTPGRMNVFDDLPFRVIMDFAHNPDGMRKVSEYVDQQVVAGRKIVAFAGTATRTDETLKNIGRAVAGHYDFYFCKEHIATDNTTPRTVAHILRESLLESGVAKEMTAIKTHGKQVAFEIFDSCEPGDLLVMLMGHVEKHQLPGHIREYAEKLNDEARSNE